MRVGGGEGRRWKKDVGEHDMGISFGTKDLQF